MEGFWFWCVREENGGEMKRGSREGEAAIKRGHWTSLMAHGPLGGRKQGGH